MENKKGKFKEKVKNCWEKNKKPILMAAGLSCVGLATFCGVHKIYMEGVKDGAIVGFNKTLDWLDKTFPDESKARELYTKWAAENPDKIVYRKV